MRASAGVVVKLGKGFNYSRWSESGADRTARRVRVGAGRSLGRFVREAVAKGYAGVTFAEGIPGSVGRRAADECRRFWRGVESGCGNDSGC